jgi:hypothetical protein
MSTRRRVVVAIAALALLVPFTPMATAVSSKVAESGPQHTGMTPNPEVVMSKIIYDDGDATSDTFVTMPGIGTGGYVDNWLLVRGDINTVGSGLPFNIETLSYFLRQDWNSLAGTAGIWSPSDLTTPWFSGDDNTITTGFNNVTLTTPLTISTVGLARFWMGVINTYPAGAPGVECTTCRVAGVDNVGNAAPNVGFFTDRDATANNITTMTAIGSSRVPIVRAGVTATGVTVPVELLEFDVR